MPLQTYYWSYSRHPKQLDSPTVCYYVARWSDGHSRRSSVGNSNLTSLSYHLLHQLMPWLIRRLLLRATPSSLVDATFLGAQPMSSSRLMWSSYFHCCFHSPILFYARKIRLFSRSKPDLTSQSLYGPLAYFWSPNFELHLFWQTLYLAHLCCPWLSHSYCPWKLPCPDLHRALLGCFSAHQPCSSCGSDSDLLAVLQSLALLVDYFLIPFSLYR